MHYARESIPRPNAAVTLPELWRSEGFARYLFRRGKGEVFLVSASLSSTRSLDADLSTLAHAAYGKGNAFHYAHTCTCSLFALKNM